MSGDAGGGARGVIVTHARMGEALIEAAEEISGITGSLSAVSNRGATPRALQEEVAAAVGDGPAVVFVDLAAGSCGFAGRAAIRTCGVASVVTGVSLPMLLEFLFHRDLPLPELSARLVEKGRAGITHVGQRSGNDVA
jgi:mannose/fructose-specific phosphotransferase system component IIA